MQDPTFSESTRDDTQRLSVALLFLQSSPPPAMLAPPACFALFAEQMSSTLNSKQALSTAVLMLWSFTASGSHTPYSFMSTTAPVSPFTPHELPPFACSARNLVRILMGLAPAF